MYFDHSLMFISLYIVDVNDHQQWIYLLYHSIIEDGSILQLGQDLIHLGRYQTECYNCVWLSLCLDGFHPRSTLSSRASSSSVSASKMYRDGWAFIQRLMSVFKNRGVSRDDTSEWCHASEPPMVCKVDTRFILVQAECLYFQCSLLLVLLCTEVLVVGDTSWSREGWLIGLCAWVCSSIWVYA
jgi:hypothetical protein